jgi:chromosome segregation ATPase
VNTATLDELKLLPNVKDEEAIKMLNIRKESGLFTKRSYLCLSKLMKWNFIRDHIERGLVIIMAADEQSVSSSGSSGSMRSRLLREELTEIKKQLEANSKQMEDMRNEFKHKYKVLEHKHSTFEEEANIRKLEYENTLEKLKSENSITKGEYEKLHKLFGIDVAQYQNQLLLKEEAVKVLEEQVKSKEHRIKEYKIKYEKDRELYEKEINRQVKKIKELSAFIAEDTETKSRFEEETLHLEKESKRLRAEREELKEEVHNLQCSFNSRDDEVMRLRIERDGLLTKQEQETFTGSRLFSKMSHLVEDSWYLAFLGFS